MKTAKYSKKIAHTSVQSVDASPGPIERQGMLLKTSPSFYTNLFSLEGKVAIVTGAGGHLGAAMSMGLLAQGAKVMLIGRNTDKISGKLLTKDNTLKHNMFSFSCDVRDENKFTIIVNKIIKTYGKIDILVNNAFSEIRKPFINLTKNDWCCGIDNILTQQFTCCKAVLPHMANRGAGSVINIASIYGFLGIDQRAFTEVPSSTVFYSVAKAGSIQLTKELAVQYAGRGIRVNCISPGHFPKPPENLKNANPKYIQGLADMIPMKRVGCADELAGAVVYLSSEASSYVIGHNLIVDGGRSIW